MLATTHAKNRLLPRSSRAFRVVYRVATRVDTNEPSICWRRASRLGLGIRPLRKRACLAVLIMNDGHHRGALGYI